MFVEGGQHVGIITMAYLSISLTITLLCTVNLLSPLSCYFSAPLIIRGEFWRLFSHMFYMGSSFSFDFFLHIIFFLNHCQTLETSSFRARRADFIYLFFFCGVALTTIAFVGGFLFMSPAFSFAITYIWARRNPDVVMAFFGILNFRAPYLPYVMLLFSVLTGGDMATDIIGLIVGHIYYYLEDVYPFMTKSRVRLLRTPSFLTWLFNERQTQTPPPTTENNAVPRPVQANPSVVQRNMLRLAQLRQQGLLASTTARNANPPEAPQTVSASSHANVPPTPSIANESPQSPTQNNPTVVQEGKREKKINGEEVVNNHEELQDDEWDAWPSQDLYSSNDAETLRKSGM